VPELPEVETVRRGLEPRLVGRRLIEAESHPSAKFSPAVEAIGAGVTAVGRRGKYLLVSLDDGRELVVHLGMTGQLRVLAAPPADDPYVRARWALSDGHHLVFRDVRRFGRLRVVPAGRYEGIPTLYHSGPEPFAEAFTVDAFHRTLAASRARIKTRLLSQRPVAGVGNIYADEALWQAGIDPSTRRTSRPMAERLRDAIRDVLAVGLAHGGTTLRDYRNVEGAEGENQHHLSCYGRAGLACLRCGRPLLRKVVDARGTTWCRFCQRP
jgi:formamidopyrimidine-DNA glycosylase